MTTGSRPGRLRRWLVGVAVVVVLVGFMVAFNVFYVTDLRPDSLSTETLTAEAAQRGRQLLAQAAERHGQGAWESHSTLELVATDAWFGLIAHTPFNPWSLSEQKLRMLLLRGTWSSRVELLSGPDKGTVWGIQSWHPYRAGSSGMPRFADDPTIQFYLPTYQYFIEAAFRLGTAEILADIGEARDHGETYDRVFATWGSVEAHMEHDQYIVWVNRGSGLIERFEYTVRDFGGVAAGATTYSDYRRIGGVMIPHRLSIRLVMPGGFESEAHVLEVESAAWDTVDEAFLLPNRELASEGQSKR
jgi:hypothetical protein